MTTFPIFIELSERPPLVIGGSDLAAAKVRLLAKRAAHVDVLADTLGSAMQRLVDNGLASHSADQPTIAAIRGRPLVISASDDDDQNASVYAIAKSLGVPINVPDQPAYCTFNLPAIVDRGTVTVAIGTEGQAPVLAQRLRTWIERELHPRLGDLAKLAGEFRSRVAKSVAPGAGRRRLWESVLAGPAADAVLAGNEATARQLVEDAIAKAGDAAPPPAKVVLVGAGPGDPDLLTVKAVRAIKAADTILYDDLVDERVLELARREVELIPVGKRGGRPSTPQSTINDLLITHSAPGKSVVRLKGGDPFIFGRAGEELAALRSHGITVDVVPGITAAVAAAASMQIPLTDRNAARTVTFLSGRSPRAGTIDLSHLDLRALADGGHTLAIYMAVATAQTLATQLMDAGWSADCPVVAVENASRSNERRVAGTIADLAQASNAFDLTGPAILIVGNVAAMAGAGSVEIYNANSRIQEPAYA
ncbi:MAG: siroheme synthase CysG [Hyphomicrobiaceae bacterium]